MGDHDGKDAESWADKKREKGMCLPVK